MSDFVPLRDLKEPLLAEDLFDEHGTLTPLMCRAVAEVEAVVRPLFARIIGPWWTLWRAREILEGSIKTVALEFEERRKAEKEGPGED